MIKKFFQEIYARLYTERYLIYKGTGGLFHNLTALSKAIRMAKRQNRKLIIDMRRHKAFLLDFSTFFTLNMEYYEDYSILEKYDTEEISMIRDTKGKEYVKQKINYEDKIITYASYGGGLIDKKIKVNNRIMEKLNIESPVNEPYIAVHFRNTDIQNDLFSFIEKIKKISAKQNIHTLYVASDDFYTYEKMKNQLENMRFFMKSVGKVV